jgi:uncharacterized protein (TIGR02246 family)
MRSWRLIPLLLIAAACNKGNTPAADTTNSTARMDSTAPGNMAAANDSAKDAIGKTREAWKAAADRKDAASVAALYTDDATFVGTETPLATGKAEIQKSLAQSLPISKLVSIDSKEVVVNGDVGYDYGTYKQEVTPPGGKTQTVSGYYLVALKKGSDGVWKIARHVATTPPAAKP